MKMHRERTECAKACAAPAKAGPVPEPCDACPIRSKTFCGALTPEELSGLTGGISFVSLGAEQTLFVEGDVSDALYSVVSGVIRLTRQLRDGRRQITGFIFPGGFVGLSFTGRYHFTVEAITPAKLCRIAQTHLRRAAKTYPHLEHKLLELVEHELEAAHNHIVLLGRKTAGERLAQFLIDIGGTETHEGVAREIRLPMSREDIADYLGLTIETVSRSLSRLNKDQVIRLRSPKDLVIERPDELRARAETTM